MMWAIVVVLFALWALGLTTSFAMGGLIHVLLVLAVGVALVRIFQDRQVL